MDDRRARVTGQRDRPQPDRGLHRTVQPDHLGLHAVGLQVRMHQPRVCGGHAQARRAIQEKRSPEPATGGTKAAPAAAPRTKLLVRANSRNFIVDANDVIYATIDNGLITLVATNLEGHSNYRTIEDLQANLDRDMFWRVHRSFLVNTNRIKEVVPWFKSSYQLRMDDKKHTEVPVSRVQTRRLRELFKL